MLTRRKRRFALVSCALFLLAQTAGCFSDRVTSGGPDTSDQCAVPTSALTGGKKQVITIYQYAFYPDTLRVTAGTTVTWVNCDRIAGQDAHTSTSDSGVWASPLFAEGRTYTRVFDRSGSFAYHCEPHPSMRGVVIVQ
jgi:plastocyanin